MTQLTPEQLKHFQIRKCYDCGTETSDFVFEARQTSGPSHNDHGTFAGDFTKVPVHANRRECEEARLKRIDNEKRARIPFYDVPAC